MKKNLHIVLYNFFFQKKKYLHHQNSSSVFLIASVQKELKYCYDHNIQITNCSFFKNGK